MTDESRPPDVAGTLKIEDDRALVCCEHAITAVEREPGALGDRELARWAVLFHSQVLLCECWDRITIRYALGHPINYTNDMPPPAHGRILGEVIYPHFTTEDWTNFTAYGRKFVTAARARGETKGEVNG